VPENREGLQGSKLFVVQPAFDEGEDWPESYGTPHLICAESKEAAEAAFPSGEYTALAWVEVYTPEEWFEQGGYPFEGLERPA
jgi:hypothetical protein